MAAQRISSNHFSDANGNPDGGNTYGPGFSIAWQRGPLSVDGRRAEPNGCFVETVITAAIDRLEFYQEGKFASGFNEEAIAYLQKALLSLGRRTADREARGVEGTHEQ